MALTRRLSRSARAVTHKVGHRGAALLFFALLDTTYAVSLFNPPPDGRLTTHLTFVQDIAPFPAWGAMWAAAGAACLVCAFRVDDRWGFAAAMTMKVAWGALYVYGAVLGVDRAYLTAVIWLCLAGWVGVISSWPEPPDWSAPPEGKRADWWT